MSFFNRKHQPVEAMQIVGDVHRLALKPGDKVMVTYPGHLSHDAMQILQGHLKGYFEGHEVFVLGDGIKVTVVESQA